MENTKTSGTCQACFGTFAIRNGFMVLHGFNRPGCGYTIGQCWGVGREPYELSCEDTKSWRVSVATDIEVRLVRRAEQAVSDKVSFIRTDYSSKIEAFEFVKGAEVPASHFRIACTFGRALEVKLSNLDREIADLRRLVKELDARIVSWVYAPEKLRTEARKVALVHAEHATRAYRKLCSPMARGGIVTKNAAEVTCSKCLAKAGE